MQNRLSHGDCDQIIMLKFGVQRAKIIGRNILCILFCIDTRKLINDGGRILNSPKAIIVFVKIALFVKILNLIKNMFEN